METKQDNRVKSFFKKTYESAYFPFYLMALLSLLLHIFIIPNYGDDPALQAEPIKNVFEWTFARFTVHSSRTLIDFFMILSAKMPVILWKLINAGIFAALPYGLSELFGKTKDRQMNFFIVGAVLLYPFRDMSTAGWIATMANYIWPLTAGVFAAVTLKKILAGEKISVRRAVLSSLALLFATSSELMCGAFFGIYLIFGIYAIVKKKANYALFIHFGIIAAMLAVHLLCPGNANREVFQVDKWFAGYSELTLAQKLEIGFSSTMYQFVFKPNYLFMLMAMLLLINTVKKQRSAAVTAIASVPVLVSGIFGFGLFNDAFSGILEFASDAKWAKIIMNMKNALTETGTNLNIHKVETLIPDAVLAVVLICIVISLFCAFDDKKKALTVLTVLAAGFASRFVMAFSPTIWSSRERTFLYFYAAIIYSSIMLFVEMRGNAIRKISRGCSVPYMIACVLGYASSLIYVIVDSMN